MQPGVGTGSLAPKRSIARETNTQRNYLNISQLILGEILGIIGCMIHGRNIKESLHIVTGHGRNRRWTIHRLSRPMSWSIHGDTVTVIGGRSTGCQGLAHCRSIGRHIKEKLSIRWRDIKEKLSIRWRDFHCDPP
jgi:hypothetical protein